MKSATLRPMRASQGSCGLSGRRIRGEFWRTWPDGMVAIEAMKLVEGFMRDRKRIDSPVVSRIKSTEPGGITFMGSFFV